MKKLGSEEKNVCGAKQRYQLWVRYSEEEFGLETVFMIKLLRWRTLSRVSGMMTSLILSYLFVARLQGDFLNKYDSFCTYLSSTFNCSPSDDDGDFGQTSE